jgi:hypothetical protein
MPTASIDNFWLFQAIRSGLPGPILLMLAFFLVVLAVGLKKNLDDKLVEYRTGFLLSMIFFFLTGWTVHFWGTAYVLFLFLMGSGVWILDAQVKANNGLRARNQSGELLGTSRAQQLSRRSAELKSGRTVSVTCARRPCLGSH